MAQKPGQHVMRVLPDGLGHDQLGARVDPGEDTHPFLLRADEPVLLVRLVGMGTDELVAGVCHGPPQGLLHLLLGGPADLVGREPQVAAAHEQDLLLLDFRRFGEFWDLIGGHG